MIPFQAVTLLGQRGMYIKLYQYQLIVVVLCVVKMNCPALESKDSKALVHSCISMWVERGSK